MTASHQLCCVCVGCVTHVHSLEHEHQLCDTHISGGRLKGSRKVGGVNTHTAMMQQCSNAHTIQLVWCHRNWKTPQPELEWCCEPDIAFFACFIHTIFKVPWMSVGVVPPFVLESHALLRRQSSWTWCFYWASVLLVPRHRGVRRLSGGRLVRH